MEKITPLDKLLPNGLPWGYCIMILGDPGAGKSALAQQFVFDGVKKDQNGVYICFDLEPKKVRVGMSYFGFRAAIYEKKDKLALVDAQDPHSPEKMSIGVTTNMQVQYSKLINIIERVEEPFRIVEDSITTLALNKSDEALIKYIYDKNRYIRKKKAISMDLYTNGAHSERLLANLSAIYDGIILLMTGETYGKLPMKNIQLKKMRMVKHDPRVYPYAIKQSLAIVLDEGIYEVSEL